MYRNVAAKIQLFAFDHTTGEAKTGDAANITAYVSKDGGAVTVLADTSAAEMDAANGKGWYQFDVAQGETDAVDLLYTAKSSTANVSVVGRPISTTPNRSSVMVIDASGQVTVGAIANNAITAASINADAITDAKVASDVTIASVTGAVGSVTGAVGSVTGNVGGNVTGSVGSIATGGIASGSFAAGAINAAAIAADAITDAKVAADVTIASVTGAVGSVTGAVGSVTGAVGSVGAGGITAASFAANAITAAKLDPDVTTELQAGLATQTSVDDLPTNAELATALGTADDAVLAQVALVKTETDKIAAVLADTNELQTDWLNGGRLDLILDARASQTSVDDLPTNAELATALGTADDAVLAQVALVKAVTDKVNTTMESVGSPGDYVFTTAALAQGPSGSGGTPPTAAAIADAVWDETRAGHVAGGSFGEGVASVQGNVTGSTASVTADVGITQAGADKAWSTAARLLTAGTNIVLAKGTGVTGFNDLSATDVRTAVGLASANLDTQFGTLATSSALTTVGGNVLAIKTVTDLLQTMIEVGTGSPTYYRYKVTAVELAPAGGSGLDAAGVRAAIGMASADLDAQLAALPTAGENADATWDETLAGHAGAGSAGLALTNAGSAGNPWSTVIEGAYTAEDIMRFLAASAWGLTDIVSTGGGGATITWRDITNSSDIAVGTAVGSERTSVTLSP